MCVFMVLTVKKGKAAGAQGASAAPSQEPGTPRLLQGCVPTLERQKWDEGPWEIE